MNDLHVSIATPPEFPLTLPFSSIVYHPPSQDHWRLQINMSKHSLSLRLLQTQPETRTRRHTKHTKHNTRRQTQRERDEDRERRDRKETQPFSSLLHHLRGADMCVAIAVKSRDILQKYFHIFTHTFTCTYTFSCKYTKAFSCPCHPFCSILNR